MRYQDVKRKLILETSIVLLILAALAGLVYFLNALAEDYTLQTGQLKEQLTAVTNEVRTLQDKYHKTQNNMELYAQIAEKNENDGLSISRKLLRKKVNEFKPRYYLNDLAITMAPAKDLTGDKYKYKTGNMVSSELTVNFDALTDEDVYSLMQSMQDELSGAVKTTKFSITRQNKATDDSLRQIAKSGQYSMVKGSIQLKWMGIKSADTADVPEIKK